MSMPSGHGAETMPELERVMQLAYEHGYRVGLQIGTSRVVIHARDMLGDQPTIVLVGDEIESVAAALFIHMLKKGYVPRGSLSPTGGE